jgi:GDP-L-fucose synthase
MRILVTGGRGFLGSHLVRRLRHEGHEPAVPSRLECDLTDPRETEQLFEQTRPELVFHLAAEVGGIGANREHPGRYWHANLLMGANVLEMSRRAGVDKLVMVGTVCSYPKLTPVPFREEDLWNGYPEETNAPYGIAKKALLVGCQSYRAEFGLNSIFLLPANLYGPGDNVDLETSHVVPALIRRMSEAKAARDREVTLWGDGSPTREFLYVEDCAEALLLAAQRYDGPEPVNIGSGEEVAIAELASTVARLVGFDGKIFWDTSRPNGQPRRSLDVSRAQKAFGFRARTPLDEGLGRTIEWQLGVSPPPAVSSQPNS